MVQLQYKVGCGWLLVGPHVMPAESDTSHPRHCYLVPLPGRLQDTSGCLFTVQVERVWALAEEDMCSSSAHTY